MQDRNAAIRFGLWALGLFLAECLIGTVLRDCYFIRAYLGDVLVIPLLYCLIRIFTGKLPAALPAIVCGIGFVTELSQYFRLYEILGFAPGSLPAILLGTSFSWADLLCYVAGMLLIYGTEAVCRLSHKAQS